MDSLLSAVRRHAATHPQALAVDDPGLEVSYGELVSRAVGLQHALREAGARRGDAIAVAAFSLGDAAVTWAATAGLGCVLFPMDLNSGYERLAGRVDLVAAKAVVLAGFPAGEWTGGRPAIHLDEVEPVPGDLVEVDAEAMLALESERHDAVVLLGRQGVHACAAGLVERLSLAAGDRVLAVGTPDIDTVVMGLLATLLAGAAAIPAGRPVVEGERLRQLVERRRVSVLVAAPRAVSLLCGAAGEREGRLAGLRAVLLTRDRVPARLPAALGRLVHRESEVLTGWGSAETGVIAATEPLRQATDGRADAAAPVVLGLPLGTQAAGAGPPPAGGGEDGAPGEIWCAGPLTALGYVGRADLDSRHFWHDDQGTRWYRTGDRGRLLPDGRLELLDAVRETERRIEEFADVRMARVVGGLDGAPVAFVETISRARVDDRALRAHLRRRLPADLVPTAVVGMPGLPVTASGVVDRARLAARAGAAAGGPATGQPDGGALDAGAARILRAIGDNIGITNLDPRTNLLEVGSTSLEIIRAVGQIEADLDFDVDLDELLDSPYAQTLIDQYHRARPVATSAGREE